MQKCPTQALYDTYVRWCQDNAEKPVVTSTFSQYLKDNANEKKTAAKAAEQASSE